MQKTVVRNPNQSPIRRNLLNIAGIVVQGENITPPNGDRQLGGYGVAWLNNQDAASQTTGQDNPLPECNCESGGGGGGSGGGGGVQPSGNCEKKNISELKQVLDDYANQSFCDKEFTEVQFSTFIGYDKPPSDSSAKEIELRMLCPSDECNDDEELCENTDNLPVNPTNLNNRPALFAIKFTVRLSCNNTATTLDEYSFYDVFKVEPNTTTDKYDAGGSYWYYIFYPEDLVNTVQGWYDELVGCSSSSCVCCEDRLPIHGKKWGNGSGGGDSGSDISLFGQSCCRDLDECSRHRYWIIKAKKVPLSEACENLRK